MKDKYLFLKSDKDIAEKMIEKHRLVTNYFSSIGYLRLWRKAYKAYYGTYYDREPGLTVDGEQGELTLNSSNHLRNIIKTILSLILHNKIVFEPQAANTSVEAALQTKTAKMILDQFFYGEKRFSSEIKSMLEMGHLYGTSFIEACYEMDKTVIGVDENGETAYAGEPDLRAYSPMEVVLEPFIEKWKDHQYVALVKLVNRSELQALYPEFAEALDDIPSPVDIQNFPPFYSRTDDFVRVFKVYHKPTKAIPEGKYLVFCDDKTILESGPNVYGRIPVTVFRPDVKYGGIYGHTPLFDLLAPQEAYNLISSSILTNQATFGVNNIVVPKGSGVTADMIQEGLRVLQYNPHPELPNGGAPAPLQLLQSAPELAQNMKNLISDMEQISAISPTMRGGGLLSGTPAASLAITATAAMTYSSPTEQEYITAVETVATHLLDIVKTFVTEEQILEYLGPENKWAVQTFKGDDVNLVRRVRVNVGNAYSKTYFGRKDLADTMINNGLIKNPTQYIQVLETGSVDHILEPISRQANYIEYENQLLLGGQVVTALATENHITHFQGHADLLNNPEVRNNPELLSRVVKHILEHQNLMETMQVQNPVMWAIVTGQPIPAPQPSPLSGVPGPVPPGQAPAAPQGEPSGENQPQEPTQPGSFERAIANPSKAGYDQAKAMMAKAEKSYQP